MKRRGFLVAALSVMAAIGCASPRPGTGTYGYVHKERTGIANHVLRHGKEVPIKFAGDSDPQALASLYALKWNVLYPNSAGDRIFLAGAIGEEPKHTPSGPGYPVSEAYYEFTLTDWFILTPFKRIGWKDGIPAPGDDMVVETRAHLRLDDFDDYPDKPSQRLRARERPDDAVDGRHVPERNNAHDGKRWAVEPLQEVH